MSGFIPYAFDALSHEESTAKAEAFYEYMNKRRSVRSFSDADVPEQLIQTLVATAGTAPSGAHLQPWFFAVVRDSEIKRKIRLAAEEEERKNYSGRLTDQWLKDLEPLGTDAHKEHLEVAPYLIIPFRQNYRIEGEKRLKNYYVQESVGIALGMLITAIHNAGLVTLTHTPNPMNFLNTILERPKHESPVVILPIGYPADDAQVPDLQRKSLSEISRIY